MKRVIIPNVYSYLKPNSNSYKHNAVYLTNTTEIHINCSFISTVMLKFFFVFIKIIFNKKGTTK